ncbi:hypothetical protein HELRODRAFT_186439 [Helobdella robusta]|uniref:C2 domain-containing protein n=1 Tax=Helobdella robusta TaxID=6412 RepID=T1FNZ6_HELRO|nr:hypothetical protein HELRODRAFT_186439 [Helobdella robusta]ESO02415.1 hypothetical protein HELRODRAFT_186439 [Helobdella robusta]
MAANKKAGGQQQASRISIYVSCQNLLNKDVTSKSDPCCVLFAPDHNLLWSEVGRTERIKNCLNPQFSRAFEVDYYFEQVQKVRFMIYDIDSKAQNLSDDDFLGSFECTIGEAVSNSPMTRPLSRKNDKRAGTSTITITVREMLIQPEVLSLNFKAKHLDKKDLMGKSDPFLVLHCIMPDGSWQVVHKTEVIKNTLDPVWEQFDIRTNQLATINYDQPIKIECHDYDSDGSHDLIGSFTTTVNEIMRATNGVEVEWQCVNPKKLSKKGYCNSGMIYLTAVRHYRDYSFLEYVFAGLQLNFSVGVDFTASNGDPKEPGTLHYINPKKPNQYMKAIKAVGDVIQEYDSDQMYPALGFGARVPPSKDVLHEFAINFNSSDPFCKGVQGILDAYQACLSKVQLYGPTNFAPIINHVARFALQTQQEQSARNYYILLILTDGAISDTDDTIKSLVYASTLPMSVIIVGVGLADFSTMNILDSDSKALADKDGVQARRDIVQFVPMRDFENSPAESLSKHVLGEIPKQVVEYFRMYTIPPGRGVVKPLAPVSEAPPADH